MAANAAVDIATSEMPEKKAAVIHTVSVPQSFSAMFAFDAAASMAENTKAMATAIAQVAYGEVTTAVKDAKTANGKRIAAGDVIGLVGGDIKVVGSNVTDVALGVVKRIANDADVLTMLAGEQLSQGEYEAIQRRIEADHPDLEIDAQRGGQPLYPLVMAAE
jgi:dihydroxyacetone kinase-like predicted kinase